MGGAGDGGSAIHSSSKNGVPKDALRQNCITALRRLCNQVSIFTSFLLPFHKGSFQIVRSPNSFCD